MEREYVPYFVDYGSFAPPEFWQHTPLPTPEPPRTTYQYDALGRTTLITYTDGTALTTWYNGWQRAVIDAKGHMTVYRDDAFGRLTAVKEFTGTHSLPIWDDQHSLLYATTDYAYDVLDNLTTVTDTLGYTTTMSYDMLGRKTQMTDPDMGTWSYGYDAAGSLTRQTDARGQTICFYYDALNRLQGKPYRTGTNCPAEDPGYPGYAVAYAYDDDYLGVADANEANSWGRLRATWVGSELSNGHKYQYDERGRLIKETQTVNNVGYETQYTYRADDQVHTMTYPGGEVITTTYNARGLPKTLTSSLGDTYVTDASYTSEGRLDLLSLGSDLRINHDYYPWNTPNGQGRLESIQSGTAGQPTLLQDLSYGYDAVGNVQSLTDNGQTTTFTYDPLDRLLGASGAYSETYGYNAVGNLTYKSGMGSYSYAPGKPHAVTSAGGNSYSYDPNGNMTSRTVDGIAYTLSYDAENRLKSVTQGGQTTTFTYDADGQRVMRDTVTNTIVYVGSHYEARFEEGDMPQDLDGDCDVDIVDIMMVASRWGCQCGDDCYDYDFDSDCWITVADIMQVAAHWREPCPEELVETVKYYTLGGRRVAMRKVPADPPGQVGTLYYLFSDHLGSSSVSYRTSDGQTITQRYYPWGAIRPGPDNALPTDYTFTGQKLDESTGLMYYGARYYDPALGRFISADPIVPEPGNSQALNRYSYVYNNPLRYTDPTGHQPGWIGRARRYVHWWTGPGSPLYNLEVFGRSLRSINNSAGDAAIKGLDAEIERAAQDAEVPTILLAAALHHQGGSPKWMDQIADLGLKSPENVSRGIGQITIGEAERFNRDDLVLDPVPDETLAEALYIPEVSVRYMAAKLKESARLIDRYLDDPDYSTISLSEENRWLLLMPAQNIGKGSVIRFFDVCGGDWSCWFADPGIYSQVLYIRDDIAWLEEHGWTE